MDSTKWLDTIVCWNSVEYIPRRAAIWRFVSQGLYPFITSRGYVVEGGVKEFTCHVANALFYSRLELVQSRPLDTPDYKSHFYHVIGWEEWANFWLHWSLWKDITTSSKVIVQELCWQRIDLEESPQTRVVDEMLGLVEDSVTGARVEDTYLRDAAESNEWGGYRR